MIKSSISTKLKESIFINRNFFNYYSQTKTHTKAYLSSYINKSLNTKRFCSINNNSNYTINSLKTEDMIKNNRNLIKQKSTDKCSDYSKTMLEMFNLRHFQDKKTRDLRYIKHAADLLNINYKNSKIKFIHVGGTNGKGSVTKKIETALRLSGIKTGLFTSPHLFSVRERIKVNDQLCDLDFITYKTKEILEASNKGLINTSFFEILTLLMLSYFDYKEVEVGVIEVGVGGLLDSTNIINPILSIITSIGLDHCHILGNTYEEIAKNKAGIIKANVPCLIGFNCQPKEVFLNKAKEYNSDIHFINSKNTYNSYDEENSDIAREALLLIKKYYDIKHNSDKEISIIAQKISLDNIEIGIKAKQDCRKEYVIQKLQDKSKVSILQLCDKSNKHVNIDNTNIDEDNIISKKEYVKKLLNSNKLEIILDVAHNYEGLSQLLKEVKAEFPKRRITTIFAVNSSKKINSMLEVMNEYCDKAYLCTYEIFKLMEIKDIKELVKRNKEQYKNISLNENDCGNIRDMIVKCFEDLNEKLYIEDKSEDNDGEIILITGSFFIMKDSRKMLGYDDYIDDI